jgi:hypothetical protein
MMRTLTALGASLAIVLSVSLAQAQQRGPLGQRGQFIIGADRLFSLLSYTRIAQDNLPAPGAGKNTTVTQESAFSLLWGSGPTLIGQNGAISPFSVPRVGLDYVIVPNVTIGGEVLVFFTLGGSTSRDTTNAAGATTTTSGDNPGQFLFGLAPRGGYIVPLSDLFSLWLRGGFSYSIQTGKSTVGGVTTSISTNQFALDLDPRIVFTPFPHVGFTGGLTFDIPLAGGDSRSTDAGNGTTTSSSGGSSILFFGVTLGMIAYF